MNLVRIILDIVKQEGFAKGKERPLRFPLGRDCHEDNKAKCEEILKVLEERNSVIRSTNFEEAHQIGKSGWYPRPSWE